MNKYVLVFIVIAVLIGAVWWATPEFIIAESHRGTFAAMGQYGDMFGSVNALFTGLALAGIIVTILLQSRELRLQREELQLQREEMVNSREELARQADIQQIGLHFRVGELYAQAIQFEITAINIEIDDLGRGNAVRYLEQIAEKVQQLRERANELERRIPAPAE